MAESKHTIRVGIKPRWESAGEWIAIILVLWVFVILLVIASVFVFRWLF